MSAATAELDVHVRRRQVVEAMRRERVPHLVVEDRILRLPIKTLGPIGRLIEAWRYRNRVVAEANATIQALTNLRYALTGGGWGYNFCTLSEAPAEYREGYKAALNDVREQLNDALRRAGI